MVLKKLQLTFNIISFTRPESEIMPNNVSTIVSDKYNYDGYVEFYNDGSAVDLQGWTVTNTKGDKMVWSVKLGATHIVPNGYSLMFLPFNHFLIHIKHFLIHL